MCTQSFTGAVEQSAARRRRLWAGASATIMASPPAFRRKSFVDVVVGVIGMTADVRRDPDLEWLDHVRPVGLVVARCCSRISALCQYGRPLRTGPYSASLSWWFERLMSGSATRRDQKSSGVLPVTVLSFRVTLLPVWLNTPPSLSPARLPVTSL
jgi:hypothetical protein